MRIEPKSFGATLAPASAQRREGAGRAFSLEERAGASKAGPAAGAAPLATMDALIALQGESDPGERRRRSVKRGHELLDSLDGLKAALLSGRVPTADLRTLAARLAERQEDTGDAGLDDILSHIRLRAEVELAKLAARG